LMPAGFQSAREHKGQLAWATEQSDSTQLCSSGHESSLASKFDVIDVKVKTDNDECEIGTRTVSITEGKPWKLRHDLQLLAEQLVQKNTIYEFSLSNVATNKFYLELEVCRLRLSESGRKCVIIAPTVPRVREYLKIAEQISNVRSKIILGNAEVDLWENEEWQAEMLKADLYVITPQLFLDALDAKYVRLDLFSIMVVDECQYSKGSHPYARIFSKHYYTLAHGMRVLGVSTKLVGAKVTAAGGRTQAIRKLELVMDSRVHDPCVHDDVHVAPDEVG
jgi:hypothetical protein